MMILYWRLVRESNVEKENTEETWTKRLYKCDILDKVNAFLTYRDQRATVVFYAGVAITNAKYC